MLAGPLAGVRVLDLGGGSAFVSCAPVLADLGAEVICLEGLEDPAAQPDRGAARVGCSIAVDLGTPDGRSIAAKLVERSDVVIDGPGAPTLARLGLDEPAIRRRRCDLVVCELSAPSPPATQAPPLWAAIGVLSALHHRTATGEGLWVAIDRRAAFPRGRPMDLAPEVSALADHAGMPLRFAGEAATAADGRRRSPPPFRGQHTREILSGLLGYPAAVVDALAATGAIALGEPPVPARVTRR